MFWNTKNICLWHRFVLLQWNIGYISYNCQTQGNIFSTLFFVCNQMWLTMIVNITAIDRVHKQKVKDTLVTFNSYLVGLLSLWHVSHSHSEFQEYKKWPQHSKNWPEVQVICNSSVKATHLGIDHDVNSKHGVKDCVPYRIQTARKTVYAFMGAGFHRLNGLNPKVFMHLVNIYVLPRLLYGLDSIILSVSYMKLLSVYYTMLLRQIQHLPERTATCAVYLLLGQIPVEAELHKRMLNFFREHHQKPWFCRAWCCYKTTGCNAKGLT